MLKGEMVKYEQPKITHPSQWSSQEKQAKLNKQLDEDLLEGFCIGARVVRIVGINVEGTIIDVEDKPISDCFNYQGEVTPYRIEWDNGNYCNFLYGSHELLLTGDYVSVETSKEK